MLKFKVLKEFAKEMVFGLALEKQGRIFRRERISQVSDWMPMDEGKEARGGKAQS